MTDAFGLSDGEVPEFLQDEQPEAPTPDPALDQAPDGSTETRPVEPEPEPENLYPGREERPRDPVTGRFLPKEEPRLDETSAETQPEEKPTVYAGKYNDVPALEKGYRELRDLQRRTAERAKAYEQRAAEVEFNARQMEQAVRQATDYVRSLQQQQAQQPQQPQQPVYDQFGNPVQLPPQQPSLTPDQIQGLVDAQVQNQWAYQAQAMQEQQFRQQQYNEAAEAQRLFFEAHPEIERNGAIDEDVASTILAFNEAWSHIDGSTFNLGSEESLGIAYEASQRPALRRVLETNPAYMDDDEGMTLARALASQIDQQTQAPVQPTGRMQARPNTPVVERGSSPAPREASPLDEFDQAVAEYRAASKARGSEVFFGK